MKPKSSTITNKNIAKTIQQCQEEQKVPVITTGYSSIASNVATNTILPLKKQAMDNASDPT